MFSSNSSNRKNNYSKADDAASSREERMNRLKVELREHIRFLADYEILSADWLRMAESLHQIANVASMETHLPPSEENPLSQHGKKESGTLWDQVRDELSVRILLEEGKLNLILRIMHKYRCTKRDEEKWNTAVKSTSEKFHSDVHTVTDRCQIFEASLGLLLKFSLNHIESLQIMDIPQFLQHCSEIIQECMTKEKKIGLDFERMQETQILFYLGSIGRNMEELDEDRVMDLIEQHSLLTSCILHLSAHHTWYRPDALESACKFINGVLSSEAYQAEKKRFISDKAVIQALVNWKPFFINDLMTSYSLKRKDIQQLLDEITKYERTAGVVVPANISVKERVDKLDREKQEREREREKEKEQKEQKEKTASKPATK